MTDFKTERRTVECLGCSAAMERDVMVLPSGRAAGAFFFCDACLASRDAAREARDREAREERLQRRRDEALRALQPPPIFADASLAGMVAHGTEEQRKRLGRILQVARRIVGETTGGLLPPPLLVFHGGPGTGKTHVLWAIAREIAGSTGQPCRVVRLSALIRDLRAAWRDKDGPSEEERLARYIEPAFLGIDEVSRHAFYGQQIHQHLYDVINARLEMQRPTVLTTNETEVGIGEILGPALMDRLALGGFLDFGHQSFRRLPPKERAA